MSVLSDDHLENLKATLARMRAEAFRARARTSQLRTTVRDKHRVLSVTVGGHGEMLDLMFHGDSYRDLAPAELSAVIVRTVAAARADASRKALGEMHPLLHDLPTPTDLVERATSLQEVVDGVSEWVSAAGSPRRGAPRD